MTNQQWRAFGFAAFSVIKAFAVPIAIVMFFPVVIALALLGVTVKQSIRR